MAQSVERMNDVLSYDIGIGEQGGVGAIALRFHLRDGSTFAAALPPELATGLVLQLQEKLLILADKPPPSAH
jgi:hypothetical protein